MKRGKKKMLLTDTTHDFSKSSLVTAITEKASYDTYKCQVCGVTGLEDIGWTII